MHIYTLVHGSIVGASPTPVLSTRRPCASAARHALFLAIRHGLPHGIGCARCVGGLPSGHGLGGDYDVFELVLGDDVDGVCVCGGQCCLLARRGGCAQMPMTRAQMAKPVMVFLTR
jgi:hypothetical protein